MPHYQHGYGNKTSPATVVKSHSSASDNKAAHVLPIKNDLNHATEKPTGLHWLTNHPGVAGKK